MGRRPTIFDTAASSVDSATGQIGTAMGGVNAALGVAGGLSPYLGGAMGNANAASNLFQQTGTPGAIGTSMNGYFNTYLNDVLSQALSRNREEMNTTLSGIGGAAAQRGAYGGSRQAVLEGQTIGQYGRNADELTASLMSRGFDTSSALAMQELGLMQNAASGMLGAGGLNLNAGNTALGGANTALGAANTALGASGASLGVGNTAFNMGNTINANQMAAGSQQQQLLQAILSGASGQVGEYQNAPMKNLSTLLSALAGNPLAANSTTTQAQKPGLFNFLSMGAGLMGAGK